MERIGLLLLLVVLAAGSVFAQNKALSLDGKKDYVEIQYHATLAVANNAITMEAWIKPEKGDFAGLISKGDNDNDLGSHDDYALWIKNWTVTSGFNWGGSWKLTEGSTIVTPGQWIHFAVTWDGSVIKHYLNGNLDKTVSWQGPIVNSTAKLYLGSNPAGGNEYFTGHMDEVRVWNLARTAEAIQTTMRSPLTGREEGLVGYWNFDDGVARDLTPNSNHGEFMGDAETVESNLVLGSIYMRPLDLEPSTIGDTFSLDLLSYISTDLHHFTFDLGFDSEILKATGVDYGLLLSNSEVDPITCGTPTIDNVIGQITNVTCRRNTADGIIGSGVLATVNFEAVGAGRSPITIEKETFFDPKDQPIESATARSQITVFGPHAKITGRIIDAQGQAVPGVEAVAFLDDQPIGINGQTGSNGSYLIDNLTSAGRVTVKATKPGLMPIQPIEADIQIGETTEGVDLLVLEPTPLRSVVDEEGFIRNWLILGAILWENDTTRLMADQLNPKTDPDSRLPVQEENSKDLTPKDSDFGTGLASNQKWTLHIDDDRHISLDRIYGKKEGVVYASTWVKSKQEQEITLEIGHDDGVMVWLNDQLVHLEAKAIGWYPDRMDQIKKLTLKEGWNHLLLKIGNRGGGWGFQARFVQQATPLSEPEPLANLEVAPQGIARQTEADTPSGLARGTFKLELEEGLNMISLPVQPDNPMTSKSLANEIGATLVIHLDPQTKAFVPFVPEHFEGTNLEIQGGMGVIVNVRRSQTVNFTGTVWDNTIAAPRVPLNAQSVWAFGLVFDRLPVNSPVRIRNLRTGETVHTSADTPAIAFVDQSQQSVVKLQDWIEIEVKDRRWRYQLTAGDLHQAFALVSLDDRIRIPQQTRLLQNYPNPFNPETWLPFKLAQDAIVTAKIYDVTGKQIRMIQLGHIPAGNYVESNKAIYWDGKTDTGEQVASGTYFYQIDAGDYTETRKMVILK